MTGPTREPRSSAVERRAITFTAGPTRYDGDLYLPHRRTGGLVCVVMANGYGGTRDLGLPRYAERFAAHGLAALTFDYAGFGSSGGHPRLVVDPARQLTDYRAAVEFARTCAGVDRERIVLWGVSLGAGLGLDLAAHDRRVAAVIALTPFTGLTFGALSRGRAPAVLRLVATALLDAVRRPFGVGALTVPVVGTPAQGALITDPEDHEVVLRLAERAPLWRNEIAARGVLSLPRYRPGRFARRLPVPVPVLVGIGRHDTAVSSAKAAVVAARAPRGELRRYAAGHFTCFEGRAFELAVTDQIAFLRRHVLGRDRFVAGRGAP
ncbi:alpha/beta fold hydrolase [Saccharothrix sp. S26]|uniref:alpha/beta hydrolase n=1 Tax=Saccharothrix sp. S26 TaxID=2907215 RepID=UPI001F25268D|nr:alpha/beta fold hydrolase [Saccharothrix sp. S26]MCE6998369.1 alpha/beta fold hydrolase [Saccharothrix sp. S26]